MLYIDIVHMGQMLGYIGRLKEKRPTFCPCVCQTSILENQPSDSKSHSWPMAEGTDQSFLAGGRPPCIVCTVAPTGVDCCLFRLTRQVEREKTHSEY